MGVGVGGGVGVVDRVGGLMWLEFACSQLRFHHAPASLLVLVAVAIDVGAAVCTESWSVG